MNKICTCIYVYSRVFLSGDLKNWFNFKYANLRNEQAAEKRISPPGFKVPKVIRCHITITQQDFSLFFVFLVPLRVSKNSCSATGDGLKRPPTLPFTHHAHRGTRLYLGFPTNHRSSVCVAYNCCFRPKPTTSFKFLIFNFFFFIQQFYPTLLVVDAFVDYLNLHRFAPYLIFSSIDLHLWLCCIFYCHIRRLTIQRTCVVKNRQFWSKILARYYVLRLCSIFWIVCYWFY